MPMLALGLLVHVGFTSMLLLGLTLYLLRLFGQGMMTHTSMTAMGRWYAGHRGRAVSLATLGHQAGEALSADSHGDAFPLVRLAQYLGDVAAVFLVLVALPIVFALMRVERQPRLTDLPEIRRSAKRLDAGRSGSRSAVLDHAVPVCWHRPLSARPSFFIRLILLEIRGWDVLPLPPPLSSWRP